MAGLLEALIPIAMLQLTPDERQHAVAYAVEAPIQAGAKLELPGVELDVTAESFLVFVDRQPGANWGHPARYLLIARTGSDVRSVEARLPPFRPGGGLKWCVLYKAPSVSDAAVAVPR
jgi:hypothetical protein